MRKRFILFSVLLSAAASALAGEVLHVHTVTGGEVTYDFAEKPEVTFQASEMILTTTSTSVVYPLAEVTLFSFSSTETEALEQISASEPQGDASVSIFTADGRLVKSAEATNGVAHYSVAELPAGTYIIKSNQRSYKLIKK